MTDKLQQTIQEEVMKLPKEGQEAINALDWVKIAEEIGKKYLLTEGEINNFQLETLLVLIGATDPEFYAINIENHANAIKADAGRMAEEAFQKIFTPIGDSITENIKKNLKNKNPNPEQTLNFILSGGDYSAFIAPTRESVSGSPLEEYPSGGGGNVSTPSRIRATPQEGNVPIPKRMEDIRSKFTI